MHSYPLFLQPLLHLPASYLETSIYQTISQFFLLIKGISFVLIFVLVVLLCFNQNITHPLKTKLKCKWSTKYFLFHLLINLAVQYNKNNRVLKLKLLFQSRCSLAFSPPSTPPSQGRKLVNIWIKSEIFNLGWFEHFSNKRENALQSTNMSKRLGQTVLIKENKTSQIRFYLQVYRWFISICEM